MPAYKWDFDARALMDGTIRVPPEAHVWKVYGAADRQRKIFEQEDPGAIMRVFNVPGGWVVVNEACEVVGRQRGRKRRKIWYALLPGKP